MVLAHVPSCHACVRFPNKQGSGDDDRERSSGNKKELQPEPGGECQPWKPTPVRTARRAAGRERGSADSIFLLVFLASHRPHKPACLSSHYTFWRRRCHLLPLSVHHSLPLPRSPAISGPAPAALLTCSCSCALLLRSLTFHFLLFYFPSSVSLRSSVVLSCRVSGADVICGERLYCDRWLSESPSSINDVELFLAIVTRCTAVLKFGTLFDQIELIWLQKHVDIIMLVTETMRF